MMGVFVQLNTASPKGAACPLGYVVQENGCWEWVGSCGGGGYGKIRIRGRLRQAHRYVYAQERGPIPPGLTLDHLCRNPLCVNPAHLDAVPQRINNLRGHGASGRNARKTHCPRGHRLEVGNLCLSTLRDGQRKCLRCARERDLWRRPSRSRRAASAELGQRQELDQPVGAEE